MTTQAQFLRVKKLTGKAIVLNAAKHNLREIAAEVGADGRIDAARIADNVILFGPDSADGVARMAQALMDEVNVRPLKKTAVRALEVIFSLPPNTTVAQRQFFTEATRWVVEHFGVPILSSTIHNDEEAPHCHILLLPLVNGRMVGSDLVGGRAKLQGLQAAFHDKVGRVHGLARQTPQKRHSAAVRKAAIEVAFDVLDANSGLNSAVLRVLLEPHAKNPEQLLLALGLAMPSPNVSGSFVATMTRPTKQDNPIGKRSSSPIGIDGVDTKSRLSLSCVGIGLPARPFSPANEVQTLDRNNAGNGISAMAGTQLSATESPALLCSDDREPALRTSADFGREENQQTLAAPRIAHIASCKVTEQCQSIGFPLRLNPNLPSSNTHDGYTREREADTPADYWDVERGEFAKPPTESSNRKHADKAVRAALHRRENR